MKQQIFIYIGNDEIAIKRHIQALEKRIGAGPNAAMSISRLEAAATNEETLINALNAPPFLTSQRLVLLANPSRQFATPGKRKKFLAHLERMPASTLLGIYEFHAPRKIEKHWLLQWAQKTPQAQGKILVLPKNMTSWITAEAKRQGGEIQRAAAQRLAEIVGQDARHAAQEVNKLLTYVNAERPIQLSDVEQLSISVAEASIFDLVDAIGQGNARRAQALYHQLLAEQDVFPIFGMIIRQFRLLLLVRELLDENAAPAEIQKNLALHPYVVQKMVQQARRFTPSALKAIYHRLLQMDKAAKNGEMPLDLSIDLFLTNFA